MVGKSADSYLRLAEARRPEESTDFLTTQTMGCRQRRNVGPAETTRGKRQLQKVDKRVGMLFGCRGKADFTIRFQNAVDLPEHAQLVW